MANWQNFYLRVQPALVVGWLAEDPGDWVFTLCRRGMESHLGTRLKLGTTVKARFKVELLDDFEPNDVDILDTP